LSIKSRTTENRALKGPVPAVTLAQYSVFEEGEAKVKTVEVTFWDSMVLGLVPERTDTVVVSSEQLLLTPL